MIAKKKDISELKARLAKTRINSTAGVAVSRTTRGTTVRPLGRRRTAGSGEGGFVPKWG
jgi:hypothetical protein